MFQVRKFFFISLCLSGVACYQSVPKPERLIETAQFSALLRDLYTLQGLVDKQISDPNLKRVYYETYKLKIFEHYGLDSTTFAQNYNFYQHHLDSFLAIHNTIIRDYNDIIYGSKK